MKGLFIDIIDAIRQLEYLVLATAFSLVNILVRPAKSSLFLYLIEFFISVTVAVSVGLVCQYLLFSKALSFLFVACSAILARDILSVIMGFGNYVEDNKEALYKRVFDWVIRKPKK